MRNYTKLYVDRHSVKVDRRRTTMSKVSKLEESQIQPLLEPNQNSRYEITLTIENSDIYFSRFENAKPYISFHWHDSFELIYCLVGEQTIIYQDSSVILHEGDCIIINSSVLHATRSSDDNQFILVQLPFDFVKKNIPEIDSIIFDLKLHSMDPKIETKQLMLTAILDNMYALSVVKPVSYTHLDVYKRQLVSNYRPRINIRYK